MSADFYFNAFLWAVFLFVWIPIQSLRHKKRMKSLRAIRKGYNRMCKYRCLKKLTGGQSCQ